MPIRVLVVDDSAVVRRAVSDILSAEDDIEVVATAADGLIGLRRIADHRPDVVTLDVEMPGLDGIATLRQVHRRWPWLPVVMYSTLTARGATATLEALSLGAVDYATKPEGATNREEVAAQVREALLPKVRLWGSRDTSRPSVPTPVTPVRLRTVTAPAPRLIAIGVSTGGPDALATLVSALPADLSVPVVVVQHMPPIFTEMLAARLDKRTGLTVREVVDGETPVAGHVYVAPGGRHTEVQGGPGRLTLALTDAAPENSCRPAVDVLFRTATAATEGRLVAAVLTGMGSDGRIGARVVADAGGQVIAQDEETSVVWGMPGFVVRDGTASQVLPLAAIAPALVATTRRVPAGVAS